ncbi:MAG: type II secretion system protein GspN [Proteobacteria bacterium]|nr:MAG: type II secretion system protein GspN [Pseudomonadota bacterium]
MILKRTLLAVALVLALGAAAVLMVGSDTLGSYIEQVLVERARNSGIRLSMRRASFSLLGFSAEGIDLVLPSKRLPFPIKIDTFELRPSWLSWLKLKPHINFDGTLYYGNFEGSVTWGLLEKQGEGSFKLSGVSMRDHPFMALGGVRSGRLGLNLENLRFNTQQAEYSDVYFSIEDLATVAIKLRAVPGLAVPAITRLQLFASAIYSLREIEVRKFEINSSLGNLSSTAVIKPEAKPQTIECEGLLSLSSEGLKHLGPLMSLLSSGKVQPDQGRMTFAVSGEMSSPKIEMQPIIDTTQPAPNEGDSQAASG